MKTGIWQVFGQTLLIGSGAIGTNLRREADEAGSAVEPLNLLNPDSVRNLHLAYKAAGSQILITNTFAAHSLALDELHLAGQCGEINRAGVRLAREAAGAECLVWASIGPLSLGLRRDDYTDAQMQDVYRQQCAALTEADALVLETFTDPREADAALAAATATGLPVIFQLGNVGSGPQQWQRIETLLAVAGRHAPAALGVNCRHPGEIVLAAEYLLRRTALPVVAAPNAGNPHIERGSIRYEFSPEKFRAVGDTLAAAGLAVIGGCCGTTPEHIRALAAAIKDRPVRGRSSPGITATPALRREAQIASRENRVRALMRSPGLAISVEIRADRKSSLEQIIENTAPIAEAGADLFDVPDNPGANVSRDAMVVAARLQESLGVPAICHKAATHTNLIQLHATLIGCWDLGLDGILAVTGDPPSMGPLAAMSTRVRDVKSSVELLRLLRTLREGHIANGEELAAPPDLCAGCAVGQATPQQLLWLRKKAEAGAEFVFSQPVFDLASYHALRDAMADLPLRFFPGILPLTSRKTAEYLAGGKIPGIHVPESVLEPFRKLENSADQRRFGLERAAELACAIAREADGIYLVMPFGKTCYRETADLVRTLRRLHA